MLGLRVGFVSVTLVLLGTSSKGKSEAQGKVL